MRVGIHRKGQVISAVLVLGQANVPGQNEDRDSYSSVVVFLYETRQGFLYRKYQLILGNSRLHIPIQIQDEAP